MTHTPYPSLEHPRARPQERAPLLVAVGPAGGLQAIRTAHALASRDGSPLVVCSVVEPPPVYAFETNLVGAPPRRGALRTARAAAAFSRATSARPAHARSGRGARARAVERRAPIVRAAQSRSAYALGTDDPGLGAQVQESGLSLVGATYDARARKIALMFASPTRREAHFTRTLGRVRSVAVAAGARDDDRALVRRCLTARERHAAHRA